MKGPSLRAVITSFLLSLGVGLGLLLAFSPSPERTINAFLTQPIMNPLYLGNMLEAASLTLLCALGFSIGFRSGMFNLGGEGQVAAGALTGTMFALFFPLLPFPFGIIGGGLVAFLLVGLVGLVIGLLKLKAHISEVISSFLISLALLPMVDYLVSGPLRDQTSQLMTTQTVPPSYFLGALLPPSRLSSGVFGCIAIAIITWVVLRHSLFGYDTRIIASNQEFARSQGIPLSRRILMTMALSAAFHGLAGTTLVYGTFHATYNGISGGLGWAGISAALLARAHPLGAIFGSLLLSFMDTGIRAAMVHTNISLEVGGLMQGLFFLFITVSSTRKKNA